MVGPRSRDVLRSVAPALDVEAAAFLVMTWRAAEVAGVAARIFRRELRARPIVKRFPRSRRVACRRPTRHGVGLEARCREALGMAWGSVADVSAGRATLELWGSSARAALESGCSIDLHPRAFGPGRCAQTLVARTPVVLHQTTDEPR